MSIVIRRLSRFLTSSSSGRMACFFFANANRIRSRLRELTKQTDGSLHAILINLEASPEIDVTSLEMLEQLRSELQGWGIVLYFARVADRVRDLFDRSAFTERVGPNRIFPGVDSAVDAFLRDGASSNGTRGEESDRAHG